MVFDPTQLSLPAIAVGSGVCVAIIAVAGTLLTARADTIADRTGLGEAVVGAVLLGGSTSLPGIITSVVTASQGHPSLSISNAIGGIAVQTAFLGIADIAYRDGSLYHQFNEQNIFVIALTIMMTGVLLLGLLRREKLGFARIGFESTLILVLYASSVALVLQ